MERNLVQDVRVKSLQRIRTSDGSVTLKIRGEARSRAAEAKFIEALQGNQMFAQVVLEREAERAGGGIDFDVSLPVSSTPPPFEPLPIPPPQKVDQFGKPLQPGAKVLRTLSSPAGKGAPAQMLPPAPPVAAPTRPAVLVQPPANAPAARPLPERAPVFHRPLDQPPASSQDESTSTSTMRGRPPRRQSSDGGLP
jgi:hypothetical protein